MHLFGHTRGPKALGIIALVVLLSALVPFGLYLAANLYFGNDPVSSSSAGAGTANSSSATPGGASQPQQSTAAPAQLPAAGPAQTRPMMDLLAVDQKTGQPILGLTVEVTGPGGWSGRTQAGGHARVPLPADNHPKSFNIRLRGRGYVAKRLLWMSGMPSLNDGILPATYTIEMEQGVRVAGKLVNEAGQGIGGDIVGLRFRKKFANPHEMIAAIVGNEHQDVIRTDSDGNWSFNGAPADCDAILIVVLDRQRQKVLRKMQPFTPVSQLYDGTAIVTVPQVSDTGAADRTGHL